MKEDKINLKHIIENRIEKLNYIKEKNVNPYPHNFNKQNNVEEIIEGVKKYQDKDVSVAGRLISLRKMGKVTFVNILDENHKIQIYIKKDNLEENQYDYVVRKLDIGDIIGINGKVFYTKTNELSVKCVKCTILSKSVRPLPNLKEKDGKTFFSFDDKELRYRNRHLDLISNIEVRKTFVARSKIISSLRKYLDDNKYLEVETPILQTLYGGANARPFKTYHNTLEEKLYLRIADELYLKRLVIGGMNKVYEISKNFRNEGMDKNHNPEFTMLEFYAAYNDVYDMMDFTENLINYVSDILNYQGNKEKYPKFKRLDYFKILKEKSSIDFQKIDKEDIYTTLKNKDLSVEKKMNYGQLIDKAFSFFVEPHLIEPTFITNYPVEISPLAKEKRDSDGSIVERFELFISGMEIANSFTELNDPLDQRERMEKQNKLRDKGDEEAQIIDENFLQAMECGMPPCGGVGIGVDRLVMLLTNQKSIKDVILFPAMRTK